LKEDGAMKKYEDKFVVKAAIKTILTKANSKRATKYAFAFDNVYHKLLPLVEKMIKLRPTEIGKAWDAHLQTVYKQRRSENMNNVDLTVKVKVTSAKKKAELLNGMKYKMAAALKNDKLVNLLPNSMQNISVIALKWNRTSE
jgi:hypothetical protein